MVSDFFHKTCLCYLILWYKKRQNLIISDKLHVASDILNMVYYLVEWHMSLWIQSEMSKQPAHHSLQGHKIIQKNHNTIAKLGKMYTNMIVNDYYILSDV